MNTNLSKLERVPLNEAWKHEAGEFTPWLCEAENLNALADALGLAELVKVASEHWVGDFKLDILCTTGFVESHWQPGCQARCGLLLDKMTRNHASFVKSNACQKRPNLDETLNFQGLHLDTNRGKSSVGIRWLGQLPEHEVPHAHTGGPLVEQPAIGWFAGPG